jgi:hypothetical protein
VNRTSLGTMQPLDVTIPDISRPGYWTLRNGRLDKSCHASRLG